MRTLALLLVLGQVFDAATFVAFYQVAPPWVTEAERNPILLALMGVGGVAAVALVKVGAAALLYRRIGRPTVRRLPVVAFRLYRGVLLTFLTAAAASGYVGAAFNLVAIGRVTA